MGISKYCVGGFSLSLCVPLPKSQCQLLILPVLPDLKRSESVERQSVCSDWIIAFTSTLFGTNISAVAVSLHPNLSVTFTVYMVDTAGVAFGRAIVVLDKPVAGDHR